MGPSRTLIGCSSPVICREQESCQITFDRKSFNSLTYSKMIDQNARTQCSLAGLLCPKANESTPLGEVQDTTLAGDLSVARLPSIKPALPMRSLRPEGRDLGRLGQWELWEACAEQK